MKISLKERFDDAADLFACESAFIEKDYYAVKVLRELSIKDTKQQFIFSGGTSLSKGYNIIQRFSEDLDFKVCDISLKKSSTKEIRSTFRSYFLNIPELRYIRKDTHNAGRQETLYFEYDSICPPSPALRPELKVELFFEPHEIPFELRDITPYCFPDDSKETVTIPCNLPLNTMADKFVGLSCRLAKESPEDRITRHLYDLFELNKILINDSIVIESFIDKVLYCYNAKDKKRHGKFDNLDEYLDQAVKKLKNDVSLEEDYSIFTDSMSFMPDNERIAYKTAVDCYCELVDIFKTHMSD